MFETLDEKQLETVSGGFDIGSLLGGLMGGGKGGGGIMSMIQPLLGKLMGGAGGGGEKQQASGGEEQ